mmetsp:Transcript_25337/g.58509  ORF Transcript_25337/g.58509 Transcript_25337/m.58509 type:complete len:593 (-) Transcript_25337:273-2051(-)
MASSAIDEPPPALPSEPNLGPIPVEGTPAVNELRNERAEYYASRRSHNRKMVISAVIAVISLAIALVITKILRIDPENSSKSASVSVRGSSNSNIDPTSLDSIDLGDSVDSVDAYYEPEGGNDDDSETVSLRPDDSTTSPTGTPWPQVASDIDGIFPMDMTGIAVALDGTGERIVVGANGYDTNKTSDTHFDYSRGHVRVFELRNANWTQVGPDILAPLISGGEDDDSAFSGTPYDQMGSAVAISADGNTIAAGAPLSGGGRGNVFCFAFNGTDWIQRGSPLSGNSYGGNELSVSKYIALNDAGDVLAVGEPIYGSGSGRVKVYGWDNIKNDWYKMGRTLYGVGLLDNFGYSVALSGSGKRLVASSPQHDANGDNFDKEILLNTGHVMVFDYDNEGWVQVGDSLSGHAEDGSSSAKTSYGRSVSVSGDGSVVAIGAPFSFTKLGDIAGTFLGSAIVYTLDENQKWKIFGEGPIDHEDGFRFGWDVSLTEDGRRIAISSLGFEQRATVFVTSKVFIYDYISTADGEGGTWMQKGNTISGFRISNGSYQFLDLTGYSVDICKDGAHVAVGSPRQLNAESYSTGDVKVYVDPLKD